MGQPALGTQRTLQRRQASAVADNGWRSQLRRRPAVWGLYNGLSPSFWFNVFKPLSDGDAVARFDFKGTEAPTEFDPHISLAVTLDEGPPAHWMRLQDIAGLLRGIRNILTGVINQHFVPLFGAEQHIAHQSSKDASS